MESLAAQSWSLAEAIDHIRAETAGQQGGRDRGHRPDRRPGNLQLDQLGAAISAITQTLSLDADHRLARHLLPAVNAAIEERRGSARGGGNACSISRARSAPSPAPDRAPPPDPHPHRRDRRGGRAGAGRASGRSSAAIGTVEASLTSVDGAVGLRAGRDDAAAVRPCRGGGGASAEVAGAISARSTASPSPPQAESSAEMGEHGRPAGRGAAGQLGERGARFVRKSARPEAAARAPHLPRTCGWGLPISVARLIYRQSKSIPGRAVRPVLRARPVARSASEHDPPPRHGSRRIGGETTKVCGSSLCPWPDPHFLRLHRKRRTGCRRRCEAP